jgi:uroporphyrinogen-III synthase
MNHSLHGMGIVITRPVGQAKKLSQFITAHEGVPISFPLIEIAPLQDYSQFNHTISTLKTCDWAIFISSNAVQNGLPRAFNQLSPLPPNLKFAAIGPTTAAELMQMGIPHVLIPNHRFDSESLLSLPEMQTMQGKKIMIFRGVGGREVLADTLKERGAKVIFAECYQRVNPQTNCTQLEHLWQNRQCHAIVVTSSEAMRHLLKMTHDGSDDWIRSMKICVNHARIAETAQAAGLPVSIADAPGDEAMLACLQKTLSKFES